MSILSSILSTGLGAVGTALGGPVGGVVGTSLGSLFGGSGKKKATQTPFYDQLFNQQAEYDLANLGKRFASLNQAYSLLSGQNDANLYRRFQGMPNFSGQRTAKMLSDHGYGSGMADAAVLSGSNDKTQAGNEFLMRMLDPMNQAQRKMAAANVYGGNVYDTYLALQGAANQKRSADAQYEATRPPTLLESLLGAFGQVAPYIDWGKN